MVKLERREIGGLKCVLVTSGELEGKPSAAAVFLHGFGAPGTDLVPIAEEMLSLAGKQLQQMLFVFPEAPLELEPGYEGRCWWPINLQRMQMALATGAIGDLADVEPAELPAGRGHVLEIFEWLNQEQGLPSSRVLLGGFSQGAMLAADVGLHLTGRVGGLCLWSGMMINQSVWRPLAASSSPMQIVQSHGSDDPVLPFLLGERLRKTFEENGHSVEFVRFRGYHEIPFAALQASVNLAIRVVSRNEG